MATPSTVQTLPKGTPGTTKVAYGGIQFLKSSTILLCVRKANVVEICKMFLTRSWINNIQVKNRSGSIYRGKIKEPVTLEVQVPEGKTRMIEA